MEEKTAGLLELRRGELYASSLEAAKDAATVQAAGVTHLINLSRDKKNCAEVAEGAPSSHSFVRSPATGLWTVRVTVFGLKGEPYLELFRRLTWLAGKVCTEGACILVHGATDALEIRVLAVCAALLVRSGPMGTGLNGLAYALQTIQQAQAQAAKDPARPIGLPAWHIKALFEFASEAEGLGLASADRDATHAGAWENASNDDHGKTLNEFLAEFEQPNTPQDQLQQYAWRCGALQCQDSCIRSHPDRMPTHVSIGQCPLLYGFERHAVWYGGHCMVVETVCGDPRVAFIHNLVTAEEAEELKASARAVGLRQSLVGGMKAKYDPIGRGVRDTDEIRQEAARQGRTSSSCRVDRTLPVSAAVVLRVSHLINMSPYCSEAVQVVHYQEGQEYQTHNDWFNPKDPSYGERVLKRGQRLVSVFCYLCDVPEHCGGGTFFPELGLRFLPRTGCAALWWNQTHDTKVMDERVAHCGEKPSQGWEKWGLNVWVRERPVDAASVYRRDAMGRVVTEDGLTRLLK